MGALTDLRARVAVILTPTPADDWNVQAGLVDAVEPPAYLLVWSGPDWVTPGTHCSDAVRLDVIAVAARVDVEGGEAQLELLVEHARPALRAAGLPPGATTRPAPFEVGGVTYLAARTTLTVPITL